MEASVTPTSKAFAAHQDETAGNGAPKATPADAFRAALRAFVRGPRLDMEKLAQDLGISKTTLYRWTGPRDQLLSEVLCFFGEEAVRIGREASAGTTGVERIELFTRGFVESIVDFEPHRRFVRTETELAFRLVLTRGSLVQSTVVERFAEVMREEEASGTLRLRAPADDLAYAAIRIIEGFIYNDALTEDRPDVDKAVSIVCLLVD
jgi:AcrR family transcriptional regulator